MHQKHIYFLLSFFSLSLLFLSGCAQKKQTFHTIGATKYTSAARHKATLKPYTVKHKSYTPTWVNKGDVQYGISSWYGPHFHGKYTSNGEIYNMYERTAAHKTFPMDTIVRVDNRENGKSTVVRINDRGPFVQGRIIDCSYKAGKDIGLDRSGIAKVKVTVLGIAGNKKQQMYLNKHQTKAIKHHTPTEELGIQLGAYKQLNGAIACSRKYQNHYKNYRPIVKKVYSNNSVLYKVWLVGFKNRDELRQFKEKSSQIYERI